MRKYGMWKSVKVTSKKHLYFTDLLAKIYSLLIHVRKTQPLHWGHTNTYTRRRKADGLSSSNHAKISRGGVFPFFHSFMLCLIELVNWKQKWNMYFSQLWHAIDVKSISVACTSPHGSYVMRTKVGPLTPSQIVTQFLIWFYVDWQQAGQLGTALSAHASVSASLGLLYFNLLGSTCMECTMVRCAFHVL